MKRAMIVVLLITLIVGIVPQQASASGQAWAVIDAETGRLLEGHNENLRLPIASLTKIWTAFTFLESGIQPGNVEISAQAASAEGSSLYMKQGSFVYSDTLLYGLMLRSGNDAAHALSEHAGGSLEGFVNLMNTKALIYGLKNTTFTNPSGLHDDQHLSTAYETALMMRYAMENETFREIASTKKHVSQMCGETYHWQNKHRLIHSDSRAIAGKTGFTKMAGRTLVTYYEKDDKKIIVVTLNDGNDWNTHKNLADKIFSNYKLETVAKKGRYALSPGIEGQLEMPIRLLMKKGEKEHISTVIQIPRGKKKESMGLWTISLDNQIVVSTEFPIKQ